MRVVGGTLATEESLSEGIVEYSVKRPDTTCWASCIGEGWKVGRFKGVEKRLTHFVIASVFGGSTWLNVMLSVNGDSFGDDYKAENDKHREKKRPHLVH